MTTNKDKEAMGKAHQWKEVAKEVMPLLSTAFTFCVSLFALINIWIEST
jgi:hypothetical protein